MLLQLYEMGQRVVYCIWNQFWSIYMYLQPVDRADVVSTNVHVNSLHSADLNWQSKQ